MPSWPVTVLGVACGLAILSLAVPAATPARAEPADSIVVSQPFWVEQLAEGLDFPSAMTWLPDGDILVTERPGSVRRIHRGVLEDRPLPGVPVGFHNMLNGAKDIALDPDFATSHLVYLLLAEGTNDAHYASVYRMHYDGNGFADAERIYRSRGSIGGSGIIVGRILFLPDKTLLVGVTEDHFHKQYPQRLDSDIGKIVRIARDGSAPADNPFVGDPSALSEIWSFGHRVTNGLCLSADRTTVYQVEVGPQGGDEFNILKPGGNFGWPKASWGFDYTGLPVGPIQFGPGIEDPVMVWSPSASPSGIACYSGDRYPFWRDSFFVGTLNGKALERIRLQGRSLMLRERLLTDLDERIRDVRVGPDGLIYLLTDHDNGRLLRLVPGQPDPSQLARVAKRLEPANIPMIAERLPGDAAAGKLTFERKCASCHSVSGASAGTSIGPDLKSAFGRQAGALAGYPYSAAMAQLPQTWVEISLNLLLADPSGYVEGTRMAMAPVSDPQERRDIIAYLKLITETGE